MEQTRTAAPYPTIAVLGAGSWGTALAAVARRAGRNVVLWGRDENTVRSVADQRANEKHLPGVELPAGIRAADTIDLAVASADAVLVVVPSHVTRSVCLALAPCIKKQIPVAVCAKGIEEGTGMMMTQVAEDVLDGNPVGVLSGPTFAREAALNHPTSVTVAFPFDPMDRVAPHSNPASRLSISLGTETFRPHVSDDVVGVEIGGAIKNVIAIACGMMTGAGFAENTRAALITQGIEEMRLITEALGGRLDTVTGLAGVGDLAMTCSSPTSRNMMLGLQLGKGRSRSECFEGRPVVVEGELNCKTVTDLARRLGLKLPVCEAVRAVLHEQAEFGETFARLWARPLEAEPSAMRLALEHPASDAAITDFAERIA
jgi:glycerol-3-phosphate dehydrogenase (NAD(P)+)